MRPFVDYIIGELDTVELPDLDPSLAGVKSVKMCIRDRVTDILQKSMTMFEKRSQDIKLGEEINQIEEHIDERTRQLRDNHIDRLNQGLCSAISGTVFMDLLTNLERIADHSTNVAFSMNKRLSGSSMKLMNASAEAK